MSGIWNFIVSPIKKVLALVSAFFIGGLIGKYKQRERQAIEDEEEALRQAREWANAPHTDDDFHKRMRERIEGKR